MPVCQLLGQSSLQTHLCCKDTSLLQIENARSQYTNTEIHKYTNTVSALRSVSSANTSLLQRHISTSN